eukprot:c76_g1_i1.p1 GENE.c76_g1_i1~~c76_g1_i1.p1  ORF type:complete len:323 (-),score=101.63 c76_g1_i1:426-1265(-)
MSGKMLVTSVQWVPDKQAPKCFDCQEPFNAIRRRHHCRCCGGVFCTNCSSHNVIIYGEVKRACSKCTASCKNSKPELAKRHLPNLLNNNNSKNSYTDTSSEDDNNSSKSPSLILCTQPNTSCDSLAPDDMTYSDKQDPLCDSNDVLDRLVSEAKAVASRVAAEARKRRRAQEDEAARRRAMEQVKQQESTSSVEVAIDSYPLSQTANPTRKARPNYAPPAPPPTFGGRHNECAGVGMGVGQSDNLMGRATGDGKVLESRNRASGVLVQEAMSAAQLLFG